MPIRDQNFNNLDELQRHRSNISYQMTENDRIKYNIMEEREKQNDMERMKRLSYEDRQAEEQFNRLNRLMLK